MSARIEMGKNDLPKKLHVWLFSFLFFCVGFLAPKWSQKQRLAVPVLFFFYCWYVAYLRQKALPGCVNGTVLQPFLCLKNWHRACGGSFAEASEKEFLPAASVEMETATALDPLGSKEMQYLEPN